MLATVGKPARISNSWFIIKHIWVSTQIFIYIFNQLLLFWWYFYKLLSKIRMFNTYNTSTEFHHDPHFYDVLCFNIVIWHLSTRRTSHSVYGKGIFVSMTFQLFETSGNWNTFEIGKYQYQSCKYPELELLNCNSNYYLR